MANEVKPAARIPIVTLVDSFLDEPLKLGHWKDREPVPPEERDPKGPAEQTRSKVVDMTTLNAMYAFLLFGCPRDKASLGDVETIDAIKVALRTALKEESDTITLEHDDYEWLLAAFRTPVEEKHLATNVDKDNKKPTLGTVMFGQGAAAVLRAFRSRIEAPALSVVEGGKGSGGSSEP